MSLFIFSAFTLFVWHQEWHLNNTTPAIAKFYFEIFENCWLIQVNQWLIWENVENSIWKDNSNNSEPSVAVSEEQLSLTFKSLKPDTLQPMTIKHFCYSEHSLVKGLDAPGVCGKTCSWTMKQFSQTFFQHHNDLYSSRWESNLGCSSETLSPQSVSQSISQWINGRMDGWINES